MNETKKKKELIAEVLKDKMIKSRVVVVKSRKIHSEFHKYITITKKYIVHDENNESHVGDKVLIQETRPLSKMKRWKIVKIIKRAQ